MRGNKKFVTWFSQLGGEDIALAGSKRVSLAEMTYAGIPVPQRKLGGEA